MNEKQIDDIVLMLDNFIISNGGRMNITVEAGSEDVSNNDLFLKEINQDCSGMNSACMTPTILQSID